MKISIALLALFTLVIANSSVLATKHFVMNGDDSGNQSLRYFIQSAAPSDTIMFSPDIVVVTLTSDELKIEKPVCIFGNSNKTEIRRSSASGTADFRIFRLINSGAVFFKNLVISNGKSMLIGDIIPLPGGAIQINDTNSLLSIHNCIIHSNNSASGVHNINGPWGYKGADGGDIYNMGSLYIENTMFYNNKSGTGGSRYWVKNKSPQGDCKAYDGGDGGAIYNSGELEIYSCIFILNKSGTGGICTVYHVADAGNGGNGGAIYNSATGNTKIVNSLICLNSSGYAPHSGYTAIPSPYAGVTGSGGGIMNYGNCELYNTTVAVNSIPLSVLNFFGTIEFYHGLGGGICNLSYSHLQNTVVYGNYYIETDKILNDLYSTNSDQVEMNYCLVGNINWTDFGIGNLVNVNPSFIDSSDFHLAFNSPCINAGDPDTTGLPVYDLDGNIRVIENRVDMGAYEFQGYSPDGSASAPGDIFIFPNPFHDRFTIFIPENLRNTITDAAVHTLSGQIVFETTFNSRTAGQEVELPSSLSKGIYLLVIRNTKACTIHKIIKL